MEERKLIWGVKQEHLDMSDNILLTAGKFRNQVHLLSLLIEFKYFLCRQMSCSFLSFRVCLLDEKFWSGGFTEVATFKNDLGWPLKHLVMIVIVSEKLLSDRSGQVFNKLRFQECGLGRWVRDI